MPECDNCGKKATVFDGNRWWCEHHYKLLKKKAEQLGISDGPEKKEMSWLDLGLTKI